MSCLGVFRSLSLPSCRTFFSNYFLNRLLINLRRNTHVSKSPEDPLLSHHSHRDHSAGLQVPIQHKLGSKPQQETKGLETEGQGEPRMLVLGREGTTSAPFPSGLQKDLFPMFQPPDLVTQGPSPWNMANQSHPSEFVLLGFSFFGELQVLLYGPFLMLYLLAFVGNTIIIVMVIADPHLRTPMYFFLGNFSLLEILVTMTTVPRMLSGLLTPHKVISFCGCLFQFYFYFSLGSTSFLILSDMALDRFVAICHPLRYGILMSWAACARLAGAAWAAPFLAMVPTVLSRAHLNYCHGNVINHFFCDNVPLLQLSCSDTSLLELWDFMMAVAFVLSSFLVTLVSYGYIVTTVLRMPSANSRQKAFSTCGSHLTLVFIGYSSTIFLYVRPGKAHSVEVNKIVALVTSILTPSLSPFIFTLRNKTFKAVLQGQMQRLKGLHRALP